MTRFILLACTGWIIGFSAKAQEAPGVYRNFPIIITAQLHSLSMPFRHLGSNFSNIGIGVGTEVSFNGKHNWVQQVQLAWYRNRTTGNGILLYTQPVWRPGIAGGFNAELKAGAGYRYGFRPVVSYKPVGGDWITVGKRGKGMLVVPLGVALGYSNTSSVGSFSPFIGYQFLIVSNYNSSIPIVPETLIQFGSRFHAK